MAGILGCENKEMGRASLTINSKDPCTEIFTPIAMNLGSDHLEVLFPKERIFLPGDTTVVHLTRSQGYQLAGLCSCNMS